MEKVKEPITVHLVQENVVRSTMAHQSLIDTLVSMDSHRKTKFAKAYMSGKVRIYWKRDEQEQVDVSPQQNSYLQFLKRCPKLELFIATRSSPCSEVAKYYGKNIKKSKTTEEGGQKLFDITERLKQPIKVNITYKTISYLTKAQQTFINSLSSLDTKLGTTIEEDYKSGKLRVFWLKSDGSHEDIWPKHESYEKFLKTSPKMDLFVVLLESKSLRVAKHYGVE